MKVLKAKYYSETQEVIPLDPQPVRINGVYNYERSGTDEKGEYVVIDFMIEGDTLMEYDTKKQNRAEPLEVIITEEEWNKQIVIDIDQDTTELKENVANVEVTSLQKSSTINTEKKELISTMETEKSTQTIVRFFLNVWDAIKSIFRH